MSTASTVVYDREQFSLDDDITRRLIYRTVGSLNDIVSSICFSFVYTQFKKGATQWNHLEEPYASLYFKIKNLDAFALGNKKINSVVQPPSQKKRKVAGAPTAQQLAHLENPLVSGASEALDIWYGNCRANDSITTHYETLFDSIVTYQVCGFRVWVHSKVTKKLVVRPLAISSTPLVAPIQQSSNDDRVPVDVLSVAMRHSLQEAYAINQTYRFQRDKVMTARNKGRKVVTPKLTADLALYSLYTYTNHETLQKCFANVLRRSLHSDKSRVVGESAVVFPAFKDSRAVMNPSYNVEEERNASTIMRDMFSKEAGMFYHVRTANVIADQRNINSYLRFTDRVSVYDPDTLSDVAQLEALAIRDSSFGAYYNEQTTYQLKNEHISAEFFYNMPLPHRIGAQLPTRQKEGVAYPEDAMEENDNNSNRLSVLHEEGDGGEEEGEEENDESSHSTSVSAPREEIPDHYMDEDWLAENDLDGTIAARIFDVPASYGYTETRLKPLGLHQVTYIVDSRRILACKSNLINARDIEKLDDDTKKKFVDSRRERIILQLQSTALQPGKQEKPKLLACDHAPAAGVMNQNGSITPSNIDPEEAAKASEVYRATTLNYIVKHSATANINKPSADGEEEEEETFHLDEGEEDEGNDLENNDMSPIDHMGDEEGGEKRPRFFVNKQLDEAIPFLKRPNNRTYDATYESFVANATIDVFLPVLERRRPKGNTMEDVHASPDIIRDEEWMLERDVYLRMCVLNKKMFRLLDNEFFNQKTSKIPDERYAEYKTEKGRCVTAAFVEVWNEFFTSIDVSYANEGIRGDWTKAMVQILDGKKQINHAHKTRVTRLDVLPYHQYKIWCYELFAVVLDVHYNHKIMYNNYTAKYHHCRWQVDSTDPKLNIINHGDNMGGKSFILKNVKKTCPSMVGDMVTQITDKAFNVDRNLNDMLIIIEEMENKYLGIQPGPGNKSGGGGSSSGESDALSFFKNRLTSGISAVIHFFLDEENGNRRDCKHAKSSCQGSYLCATNAKLADADKHLLSRFTLQSVPKSFGDKNKNGPKAGNDKKPQFGTEDRQHDIIYEEHKDVHRLYYFVEQCVKSNVINNNAYGVSIDGANLMINSILNDMHHEYGIPTDNGRKRNAILEFARCACIAHACWNAFTSPVLAHYQYDPLSGEYIGINPRMVIHAVFPFLIITKDMVIDALTSLSSSWQHDHLKNVLHSIAVSTNLVKPVAGKYRLVTESELEASANIDYTDTRNRGRQHQPPPLNTSNVAASRAATGAMADQGRIQMQSRNNRVGVSTQGGVPVYLNVATDHNYVSLVERTYDAIYKNISKQLIDLQISSNDIEKIMKELAEETIDISIRSYTLDMDQVVDDTSFGMLVIDTNSNTVGKPKIVIIDHCPKTGRPRVSIHVAYLKEQLPLILDDSIIQDLRRFQAQEDREREINSDSDDDSEEEEKEKANDAEEDEMADAVPEKDDTLSALLATLRKASEFDIRNEAPLIKCIVKRYENSIKEVNNMPPIMDKMVRDVYTTLFSKVVPWDFHVTADHPSSIVTADVYRDSAHAIKHNKLISKEITFYDTTKSLCMRRKGTEKVIFPNYAYISPSALATLSIFDPLITENDVIKSTQNLYHHSSSWQLREDIDFTWGKAHLANLAYEPLDTEDIRFQCINYQPFLYQIHTDYSRTRLDRHKKSVAIDRQERAELYKETNDVKKLNALKKEEDDELIATIMCEYPLCSMLSKVNHQGDIINNILHGCDANSLMYDEMILSNCEATQKDFTQRNKNVIRGKKRTEYNDEESRLEACDKFSNIYKKRLRIRTNPNLMKNKKRHHTGTSKAKSNMKVAEELHRSTLEASNKMKKASQLSSSVNY